MNIIVPVIQPGDYFVHAQNYPFNVDLVISIIDDTSFIVLEVLGDGSYEVEMLRVSQLRDDNITHISRDAIQ